MPYHPKHTAPKGQAYLRKLRGLAGASLSADDHNLLAAYRARKILTLRHHWQVCGKLDSGQSIYARAAALCSLGQSLIQSHLKSIIQDTAVSCYFERPYFAVKLALASMFAWIM